MGQPLLTPARALLPSSKSSCVIVSLTVAPIGSSSNVTRDGRSLKPPSSMCAAKVYESRRGGSHTPQ